MLHASFDKKGAELRRLAVYVVRQFVELAPTNPKVYAELLFYKNMRECNDLENNYDGQIVEWVTDEKKYKLESEFKEFKCSFSPKKKWTEAQEDELRQLYMENQNNPSTDQGEKTRVIQFKCILLFTSIIQFTIAFGDNNDTLSYWDD